MKRIVLLLLILIFAPPALARGEFSDTETTEPFAKEETQTLEQGEIAPEREVHPVIEEQEQQEEILLNDTSSFQYKIGVKKIRRISAKEMEKKQDTDSLNFKYKDLKFDSYSSKGVDSGVLTDTFTQKNNLSYKKGRLDLSGGVSNSYSNADLTKASQSFYFAPKLNITKDAYVQLNNSVDPKNNSFYQELGINYTPSFLKKSSFGVFGGVNYYGKDNTKSERLKFNTSFYLW